MEDLACPPNVLYVFVVWMAAGVYLKSLCSCWSVFLLPDQYSEEAWVLYPWGQGHLKYLLGTRVTLGIWSKIFFITQHQDKVIWLSFCLFASCFLISYAKVGEHICTQQPGDNIPKTWPMAVDLCCLLLKLCYMSRPLPTVSLLIFFKGWVYPNKEKQLLMWSNCWNLWFSNDL